MSGLPQTTDNNDDDDGDRGGGPPPLIDRMSTAAPDELVAQNSLRSTATSSGAFHQQPQQNLSSMGRLQTPTNSNQSGGTRVSICESGSGAQYIERGGIDDSGVTSIATDSPSNLSPETSGGKFRLRRPTGLWKQALAGVGVDGGSPKTSVLSTSTKAPKHLSPRAIEADASPKKLTPGERLQKSLATSPYMKKADSKKKRARKNRSADVSGAASPAMSPAPDETLVVPLRSSNQEAQEGKYVLTPGQATLEQQQAVDYNAPSTASHTPPPQQGELSSQRRSLDSAQATEDERSAAPRHHTVTIPGDPIDNNDYKTINEQQQPGQPTAQVTEASLRQLQEGGSSGDDDESHHEFVPVTSQYGRTHAVIRDWHTKLLNDPNPTVVEIPPWNQACFKYIFSATFDESLDPGEVQALGALVVSMLVNTANVYINLFFSGTLESAKFESTKYLILITFVGEFVVVHVLLLTILGILVQALRKRAFTIGVAIDIMEVSFGLAGFSALQSARIFSPALFVNNVLPLFASAKKPSDVVKAVAVVILWIVVAVLACIVVVMKVSQVGFIQTHDLPQWGLTQYLLILGLMINLAKVDQSYSAVTSSLLQSVHEDYIGPGAPKYHPKNDSDSFYSRAIEWLGLDRLGYYMFFAEVFDYHFGDDNDDNAAQRMSVGDQVAKMLNFMSFIAKLDNRQLLQYLQMTEGPQKHYQIAKKVFEEAREVGDLHTMEMAVWQADPLGEESLRLGERNERAFDVLYICKDAA